MEKQTQRSLTALLVTSTIIWVSGNGILPLLPVYAETLGASNLQIGLYLAFSYACLAIGAVIASKAVHSYSAAKSILVISGALSVPFTFCVGQAGSLNDLLLFTSLIWMLGGAGFSALNSLVARYTEAHQRGKVMGMLAITSPIGSVIGGSISGPIVDVWGFDALFLTLASLNLLWPLAGMCVASSAKVKPHQTFNSTIANTAAFTNGQQRQQWNHRLIMATSLSYMSYYIALLATYIIMQDSGFSATDISSTAIIGGLAAIPFIYLVSHASDVFGRKAVWMVCNATGMIALIILATAKSLASFWLVAFLIRFLSSGSRSIGSAWATDICQRRHGLALDYSNIPSQDLELMTRNSSKVFSQEKALALISATPWVGGILGYLTFGSASQISNADTILLLAALIPLLSICLVLPIKHSTLTSVRGAS
jgi:MFS family permease